MEWDKEYKESEPQHRHVSHLFGVYPGCDITDNTPELFKAARKSLKDRGNKTTGWKGTGSATFHYNTSIFRKMMLDYKRTGRDTYFDIQITNEDPTSSAGRQTIILEDCNIDGGILAKFDADSEYLDEDMDFTFEDFSMPEKFKNLKGFLTN